MSQFKTETDLHEILFGYDKPLNTFFCSVINKAVEEEIDRLCEAGEADSDRVNELENEMFFFFKQKTAYEINTKDDLIKAITGKVDESVVEYIANTEIEHYE